VQQLAVVGVGERIEKAVVETLEVAVQPHAAVAVGAPTYFASLMLQKY
jgi:hypothetical protein